MKKILVIAMACLMVIAAVGCSHQTKEVNVAVKDIVENIKGKVAEDMKAGGMLEENFKDGVLPGYMETDLTSEEEQGPMSEIFNKEDIEEGIVLQPMINIRSDSIIVLKAKDESKVESLKASLDKIKEQQDELWSSYLPDQYEKVKNNITKVQGKYLIYITYDNPEDIEAIFDEALN